MAASQWDDLVQKSLLILKSKGIIGNIRTIHLPFTAKLQHETIQFNDDKKNSLFSDEFEVYEDIHEWDRASVEIEMSDSTLQKWIRGVPDCGDDTFDENFEGDGDQGECFVKGEAKKLLLFSGNDYLALSCHPSVTKAAAKAVLTYGMGPKGSALSCGYTTYHMLLESSLAKLKQKEQCLLCPTGFSANMAIMSAIGNIVSLMAKEKIIPREEKVAIFSDAFNHASIIDGIRLVERQGTGEVFIYKHCDMSHLDELLSSCPMKKKVVITDSCFSMDGDVVPLKELVELRKKHGFLLVLDDAHSTLIFGENGGGVAEEFDCEDDVDIFIGTLSKAAGCVGGFIACSKQWKLLIQSRGRSFIFSAALPIPLAAAAHAAINVGQKEKWRRKVLWDRVHDFEALTGIKVTCPIISLVVGSEEKAIKAGRNLVQKGFHIIPITPPVVHSSACRLRVVLSTAHTLDDLKNLVATLSEYIVFPNASHSA